jgi:ATP-dependent exoDNAse (exonuclease V) alpha subunit
MQALARLPCVWPCRMALYSCSASIISRSSGPSAVAAAAYRAGAKLSDERQGLVWDFERRLGILHSEIVLPKGAPAWSSDRERLWNAAEMRETGHAKQNSACLARDFRIALPHEATHEQRLVLAREFAQFLVGRYGGAVDFALHTPDRKGDDRNFHAHVMLSSRRLTEEGFGAKIRELDDRRKGPIEIAAIRQAWEDIQNRLLDELGIERVSCKSLEAQGVDREATLHLGVSATALERKGEATELGDFNRGIAERNAERERLKSEHASLAAKIIDLDAERAKRDDRQAIRSEAKTLDPDRILAALTERRSTFTRTDLNRHLTEFLPEPKARSAFTDRILEREAVIPLREGADAPVSRYTTRQVLDDERRVTETAKRLATDTRHGIGATKLAETLDNHTSLDGEQREALHRATGAEGLAIIAGEAGTGKSTTLAAIREAYEADGYRVTGFAWTNAVVQNLKGDGFGRAETVQSALMRQANGRGAWDRRSVLIVDEAAMISTKHLSALLTVAGTAGAKVILAGDAKQLASIERGGMFAQLQRAHGASELHTVRRVKDAGQRDAFNAMHRGDFRTALQIFETRGALHWSATPEASRAALVDQWAKDSAADPNKNRFVLAYTNAEVADINHDIRAVRRARGELGEDRTLNTREGEQAFAVNDRIQFTASAPNRHQRQAGLFNGATGIIHAIEDARVTVALDAGKGAAPRVVSFTVGANADAGEFDAIRHGYAGTIYKAQGRTLDQTYLLHSDNWRASTGYVALSRHREEVKLFAAEKPAPWVRAEGGIANLTPAQRQAAEQSFSAWSDAKPDLAARYGLADYVGFVQRQAAEQAPLSRLDRMARQMGRAEETRAASAFTEGKRPPVQMLRKPPLSFLAGIFSDYAALYIDPAKDWVTRITSDLRERAAKRRAGQGVAGTARTVWQGAGRDLKTGPATPESGKSRLEDFMRRADERVARSHSTRPVDGLRPGPGIPRGPSR